MCCTELRAVGSSDMPHDENHSFSSYCEHSYITLEAREVAVSLDLEEIVCLGGR